MVQISRIQILSQLWLFVVLALAHALYTQIEQQDESLGFHYVHDGDKRNLSSEDRGNGLKARADPKVPMLGDHLYFDIMFHWALETGLTRLAWERNERLSPGKSEFSITYALERSAITAIDAFDGLGDDTIKFLELVKRPDIVTDRDGYPAFQVTELEYAPPSDVTLACWFSGVDKHFSFSLIQAPRNNQPDAIFSCWHHASKIESDGTKSAGNSENLLYITLAGIKSARTRGRLKSLVDLWYEKGMDLVFDGGFVVKRADVNPNTLHGLERVVEPWPEVDPYDSMDVNDAVWTMLYSCDEVYSISSFLSEYPPAVPRLRISAMRVRLEALPDSPYTIVDENILFELEQVPEPAPARPEDEEMVDADPPDQETEGGDPGNGEPSSETGGEPPTQTGNETPSDAGGEPPTETDRGDPPTDVDMGDAPPIVEDPISPLQAVTWTFDPNSQFVYHPLTPEIGKTSYRRWGAKNPSFTFSRISYNLKFFDSYVSRIEQHLVLYRVSDAGPTRAEITPTELADVFNTAWIGIAGQMRLKAITFANLIPKTSMVVGSVRTLLGKKADDMLPVYIGAGNPKVFIQVMKLLGKTWEVNAIFRMITTYSESLSVRAIHSVEIGRRRGVGGSPSSFVVIRLLDELPVPVHTFQADLNPTTLTSISVKPTPGTTTTSMRPTPVTSTSVRPPGDTDVPPATGQLDEPPNISSPGTLARPEILMRALREGVEHRLNAFSRPSSTRSTEGDITSTGSMKYSTKRLRDLKDGLQNGFPSHELAIEHLRLLESEKFREFKFLDRFRHYTGLEKCIFMLQTTSDRDQLEAGDDEVFYTGACIDLHHFVLFRQPKPEWFLSRSVDLKDIITLGAWRDQKLRSQYESFSFLNLQDDSETVLQYLFDLRSYDKSQPIILVDPSSGRQHENLDHLVWLLLLGLAEVVGVQQYAKGINISNTIWLTQAIMIRWTSLNSDEPLKPEISVLVVQSKAFNPQPYTRAWTEGIQGTGGGASLVPYLRVGIMLHQQGLYRRYLPKPSFRADPLDDWTAEPYSTKEDSGFYTLPQYPGVLPFLELAFGSPWKVGSQPGVFLRGILGQFQLSSPEEAISYQTAAHRNGGLIILDKILQTANEPDRASSQLATVVFLTWKAATVGLDKIQWPSRAYGLNGEILPPQLAVIMVVSDQTAKVITTLREVYSASIIHETNKWEDRKARVILRRPKQHAGRYAPRDMFFVSMLGVPEIGSFAEAFQTYQDEMGTWRHFINTIYLEWSLDGDANDFKILLEFKEH
ncbi:hypothetical protein TWF281_010436 [Arthrobotrys megalospora]